MMDASSNHAMQPQMTLSLRSSHSASSSKSSTSYFFRSASPAPDGSAVLTHADDGSLALHSLDLAPSSSSDASSRGLGQDTRWTYKPPSAMTSYAWWPYASSDSQESYCLAMAARDQPLLLLDAQDARRRASYPLIDHTERFVAPNALAFSSDGTR